MEFEVETEVVELGDHLHLHILSTVNGAIARLVRMPDMPLESDITIMRWEGNTFDAVKTAAAKWLRTLGCQIDGIPTVTSIEVRNDITEWEPEQIAEGLGGLERLKVIVRLEDDPTPRMVFATAVEPMNQMINSSHNAWGFRGKPLDLVGQRWQEEARKNRKKRRKRT